MCDCPGQEFVDPIDGMIGNARKHLAQIGFGVDAIQFRCADQRVRGSSTLATTV